MTPRTIEPSPRLRARIAGVVYMCTIPLGFFSLQYVPSHLIVHGDVATTAKHILANETLFRLGIVSDLIGQIVLLLAALALYQLFKSVNQTMAGLMVLFNLLGMPIAMLSELNNIAVLVLVHQPASLIADQHDALIALFLQLHASGLTIAELFWGLWLFPMGYLVITSRLLPSMLGFLLMIAGVGYVAQSSMDLLFPTNNVNIVQITSVGELLFPLWLVIRGVNVAKWDQHLRALA